jgi:hypothetical protein
MAVGGIGVVSFLSLVARSMFSWKICRHFTCPLGKYWSCPGAKSFTLQGGWLAENLMSYGRVMKFVYLFVKHGPMEWTEDQKNKHSGTMDALNLVLRSYSAVASRLMQEKMTEADIQSLDDCVKVFLSDLDEFGVAATEAAILDEPFWGPPKGNFLSFLSIVDEVRRLGPVRDRWDGNCEKYIQEAKREIKQGVRPSNSFYRIKTEHVMRRFMANLVSEAILDQVFSNARPPGKKDGSIFVLQQDLASEMMSPETMYCVPIISIRGEEGKEVLLLVISNSGRARENSVKYKQIILDEEAAKSLDGCLLFPIKETVDYDGPESLSDLELVKVRSCVMLPTYFEDPNDEVRYFIVSDDWHEYDGNGVFAFPAVR